MWKKRNDDSECWSELRLRRKWTKETKEGGEHRELNQLRTFVDCDDLSHQWMFSNYCPDKRLREESYSAAVDTCGIKGGRRFRWAPHDWWEGGEQKIKAMKLESKGFSWNFRSPPQALKNWLEVHDFAISVSHSRDEHDQILHGT